MVTSRGPRRTSLSGMAVFGPHGGASDGSFDVGTEAVTMREGEDKFRDRER